MYSYIYGADIFGIEARMIRIEADVNEGLPVFDMVGFLASAVKEARERVRISLKNTGVPMPPKRITVNLSPANLRKEGTSFDLPIAVALLAAFGRVPADRASEYLVLGELGLDGRVCGIQGVLAMILEGRRQGMARFIVPAENVGEAALVKGVQVYCVESLQQVRLFLRGEKETQPVKYREEVWEKQGEIKDFLDVCGQEEAKRAVQVAVSGRHNLLMIGPPGSGKTMMAKRIPSIMPDMTFDEKLAVTNIYSVAGQLGEYGGMIEDRPFRAPYHNVTKSSFFGGGMFPRPGEITLAGKGVLFLDEMTEFKPEILEGLRQPLEDKDITIVRMGRTYTYPADFMLVGAMNPCKCGYYPDRSRCNCSEQDIKRYIGKISMPLWDRFDMCIKTDEIGYEQIRCSSDNGNVPDSESMKQAVMRARLAQLKRFNGMNIKYNSQMSTGDMKKFCRLGEEEEKLIKRIFAKKRLTARGYSKILKTARTIADIDGNVNITTANISEAFYYRGIPEVTIH